LELLNFTCTINPPTKNEQKYLGSGRKRYKNPKYFSAWDAISVKLNKHKLKKLSKEPIILNLWNGFKKIDIANFLAELEDRLQGVVYLNDNQIKEEHIYKDDNAKVQYFKVIIEIQT